VAVRIVIPVVSESGLDSRISEHFGRTPFFAVVDLDEKGQVIEQKTVPNAGEHFGIYQSERVAVLRANSAIVKNVIAAYNKEELEELTQGCHEARHPE